MPLKSILWNVQDLFIFMDKYQKEELKEITEASWQLLSSRFIPNKDLKKVWGLADFIQNESPDLCFLTEVGGLESLKNFSTFFLNDDYIPIHAPSNSDRGIDMAILVKKSSILAVQSKLHNKSLFARGVLQLSINLPNTKKVHFLLTHLKSKLHRPGGDFEGRSQRMKEVEEILRIFKRIDTEQNTVATYILGDLNGVIFENETEEELRSFAQSEINDLFTKHQTPSLERVTYIYFNKQNQILPMQLDYVLSNPKGLNFSKSPPQVKDFNGTTPVIFPISLKQKRELPSDHYPVIFELILPS